LICPLTALSGLEVKRYDCALLALSANKSSFGNNPGVLLVEMEGRRVLFGQDIHGPIVPAFGSDQVLYQKSLQEILALEADILCEGHFGVYQGKDAVAAFIRQYL
jgi:hypothetical protein